MEPLQIQPSGYLIDFCIKCKKLSTLKIHFPYSAGAQWKVRWSKCTKDSNLKNYNCKILGMAIDQNNHRKRDVKAEDKHSDQIGDFCLTKNMSLIFQCSLCVKTVDFDKNLQCIFCTKTYWFEWMVDFLFTYSKWPNCSKVLNKNHVIKNNDLRRIYELIKQDQTYSQDLKCSLHNENWKIICIDCKKGICDSWFLEDKHSGHAKAKISQVTADLQERMIAETPDQKLIYIKNKLIDKIENSRCINNIAFQKAQNFVNKIIQNESEILKLKNESFHSHYLAEANMKRYECWKNDRKANRLWITLPQDAIEKAFEVHQHRIDLRSEIQNQENEFDDKIKDTGLFDLSDPLEYSFPIWITELPLIDHSEIMVQNNNDLCVQITIACESDGARSLEYPINLCVSEKDPTDYLCKIQLETNRSWFLKFQNSYVKIQSNSKDVKINCFTLTRQMDWFKDKVVSAKLSLWKIDSSMLDYIDKLKMQLIEKVNSFYKQPTTDREQSKEDSAFDNPKSRFWFVDVKQESSDDSTNRIKVKDEDDDDKTCKIVRKDDEKIESDEDDLDSDMEVSSEGTADTLVIQQVVDKDNDRMQSDSWSTIAQSNGDSQICG